MAFGFGTRKLFISAGLAVGCGTASAVLFSGLKGDGFKARAANVYENHFNDHSNTGSLFASLKWDNDWDRMEPLSPTEPNKSDVPQEDKSNDKENEEKPKPKACRHIILVRHGQYNSDEKTDSANSDPFG